MLHFVFFIIVVAKVLLVLIYVSYENVVVLWKEISNNNNINAV